MKSSTYTATDLRLRIVELESQALVQEEELKASAKNLMEDLKPSNLIKDTFRSTVKAPGFSKNLLKGALGLTAGFLSKKLFVMGSSSIVKKALGTVVELGVAKAVTKNAEKLTSKGIKMLQKATK